MPTPRGTGFFISAAGHFLTARHVIDGQKVDEAWLQQSPTPEGFSPMLQSVQLVKEWPEYDIALLEVDFNKNANKAHLEGMDGFPFIEVEMDAVEEGTPVYAFGYPLPEVEGPIPILGGEALIGHAGIGHRTTAAIVSSTLERTRMVATDADRRVYVLDAALNYGNSGGPIIVTETGKAFAVCVEFQPVTFPQQAPGPAVRIASLYGIAASISNIRADLTARLNYLT